MSIAADPQEAAVRLALPPSPVDNAPKALEQLRHAMNLIEDHQFVLVVGKIACGIGKPSAIFLVLKVEIN
jgi:hypothetical protein